MYHPGRVAALLAALLGTCSARAQSATPEAKSTEPFRMIWSSSVGCGDAASFLAELKSRTSRLRPARDGEPATTLVVRMYREATGARGQLTVSKPGSDLTVREVPGRNCQEVASAMALIAALMVDPLAAISEHRMASSPLPAPPPPPSSPRRRAWALGLEQRLTARTAVAPGWTWSQALSVMLIWQASPIRPSLQLSAQRARASTSRSLGSADLTWSAAQLVVCPWGLRPGARWDVRACALFQVGRLEGVGYDTPNAAESAIFWSSAGAQLEGRLQLVGPLWLGLEAGLLRPFTRERFYVDPSQTLHQVPNLGASLGGGLGLLFF
jgi:hypothetical protein